MGLSLYDLIINPPVYPEDVQEVPPEPAVPDRDPFHDPIPGDVFKAADRSRVVTKLEKGNVFYDVPEMDLHLQTRLSDWRGWNRRETVKLIKRGDE
jgi:hypothetical protein